MSAEKTDYKTEALDCLDTGDFEYDRGALDVACLHQRKALVHSNLAIAEGQERVAEEIRALREGLDDGELKKALRDEIAEVGYAFRMAANRIAS